MLHYHKYRFPQLKITLRGSKNLTLHKTLKIMKNTFNKYIICYSKIKHFKVLKMHVLALVKRFVTL